MLKNIKIYLLVAIFATLSYDAATSFSYRDRVIGCLYSDVCEPSQICFDDNAFGRCEELAASGGQPSSTYVYELDRKTLQLLATELDRLQREGFNWADEYTQCILKTVLNDRPRIVYDSAGCDYLRLPVPFVDLLLSEPISEEPSAAAPEFDFYSQPQTNDAILPRLSVASDPSPISSLSSAASSSVLRKPAKLSQPNRSPSTYDAGKDDQENAPTAWSSRPPALASKSRSPILKSKQPSDVNHSPLALSSNTRKGSGKSTQLSDESIKSKLRSKHLKRTPSIRFVNTDSDRKLENGDLAGSEDKVLSESENRQLDMIVQMLLQKLKTSDLDSNSGLETLGGDSSDNENSAQKTPESYLRAVDSDLPYMTFDRKYEQPNEENPLISRELQPQQQQQQQYLPLLLRKPLFVSPQLYTNQVSADPENDESSEDQNNLFVLDGSLPSNLLAARPEIRVLRNADEQDSEQDSANDSPKGDDTAELLGDQGVIMVDVIENGNEPKNSEPSSDDVKLLADILESAIQNEDAEGKRVMAIGNIADLDADENGLAMSNGDDDDDNINVKEILLGDISYNNNFDAPNFYRNHRFDIKKPGPRYYEEYFFKPDEVDSFEAEEADDKSSNEPVLAKSHKKLFGKSAIVTKKDNGILSSKPVAEGPVKVDAKSDTTIIIRSAEEGEETNWEAIDSTHTYVVTDKLLGEEDSRKFVKALEQVFKLPRGTFSNLRKEDSQITFKVNPNYRELNASQVAFQIEEFASKIKQMTGYSVKETGIGDKTKLPVVSASLIKKSDQTILNIFGVACAALLAIGCVVLLLKLFTRNAQFREKMKGFVKYSEPWLNFDYQDLCRQRMQGKSKDKEEKECAKAGQSGSSESISKNLKNVDTNLANQQAPDVQPSPPSRSSTSSWVEEPVSTCLDVQTGHVILSYMEDHLKKKDRLDCEWEALCAYEADPCSTNAAAQKQNANKNRYPDILAFDHSRVILNDLANSSNSDYINANTITDHDPRNPAYIVTQGPMSNTKADFWQMIWEQGSVIIVMLCRLRENGLNMCDRYWPEEGSEIYQNYEVHLVSEHIWCEDYLVRSFYLKNLKTSETRTVTQFHFLSWPENGIPPSTKAILDFRRKVNKSYKGRSCPMVVHCSDGIGRTGTYILIDMVLNRLAKGAKEIDIAASLEHIRDQRMGLVKNKAQFEFVLLAVADEVQAILKALNAQNN